MSFVVGVAPIIFYLAEIVSDTGGELFTFPHASFFVERYYAWFSVKYSAIALG
jgi:hypothetical protein